jgi:DNA-binding NarL/FixJ family response regulator
VSSDRLPIRVAIADDQSLVRTGLRMVLEAEEDLEVVGEAHDGRTAVELVGAHEVDVILMDVRMPGVDGIAATEAIMRGGRPTRVLVLTTFDLDEYAFAAIRTVHAGEAALAPRVTRRMIELFGHDLPRPGDDPPGLSELTAREREILIAVAEGGSNAEIAAQFFLSESTVKTHVGRVLLKLDARDRVQLVIYAYRHGLLPSAGTN